MPQDSASHLLCRLHLDARWDAAALAALLVSGIILVGGHEAAMAQTIDNTLWVTNGTVNAMVQVGSTIYIGGNFTQVGPATGGAIPLDATTGQPIAIPKVAGYVNAVAPDGTGGWYVGGTFTHVGGVPRSNLAHILADGTVSAWNPNPEGGTYPGVYELAVSGTTVYAGGRFTSIGGQARNNIAALDASSGLATAWDPNVVGGDVRALALSGSTVYVGGYYTGIGGQMRNHIAALDASTGLATPWNPNASAEVDAIAVSGSTVYVCGWFTSIGGQMRNHIAALDASSGLATPWNPDSNNPVYALAVSGTTIYAGGDFWTIGGQTRYGLAALDASSGFATAWNPSGMYYGPSVWALAVSGSTVYVGGIFTGLGGQDRNNIAALRTSNGNPTAWNPNPNYGVFALAVSGNTVYAGGGFTSMGGQARNHLAALDASTGIATAWNPGACCEEVKALAVNGSTVYAGGSFTGAGGQARRYIAALDASSGLATAWNPNANDPVLALAVSGNTVYVGGNFTSIGGGVRNRIAAVDASSGVATAWNPNAGGIGIPDPYLYVHALAVSGNTVYAGGSFGNIGGQARTDIAALDAATGLATPWNPNAGGPVNVLTISGSTVYAGGYFTVIGGQPRNYIAALDAASGLATAWNPNATGGNGGVNALAVSGSTVYAGGQFTSIGGQPRNTLGALDASSGLATPWNPNPNTIGSTPYTVYALTVTGSTVYAGGTFTSIGGEPQSGIAAISADAGPVSVRLSSFQASPQPGAILLSWSTSSESDFSGFNVQRSVEPETGFTQINTQPILPLLRPGPYRFVDSQVTAGVTYYYRVEALDRSGSKELFGPVSARSGDLSPQFKLTASPNPFWSDIALEFELEHKSQVSVVILDLQGRKVRELVTDEFPAGTHRVTWEGQDDHRGQVVPGLYFARLVTGDVRVQVQKLFKIR